MKAKSTSPAVAPFMALVGDCFFQRREALDQLFEAIKRDSGDVPQVRRVEGKQADAADVLDETRTFSMFGGRRVVIVDDAEPFITRHRQALEGFAGETTCPGVLVLICRAFDKRTRLFKALSASGAVLTCEPLKGRAVAGWLTRRAREAYAKRLDEQGAELIRRLAGDDLGLLDMELAKLSLYVGPREEIRPEDVDRLVGNSREENVFALLDAMAQGDAQSALLRWRQVVATDPSAKERSIGGLAWGVRRLLEARRAYDNHEPMWGLARKLWLEPADLERRLQRVSARVLEERLGDLLMVDLAAKSGGNLTTGIETWIVKHALTGAPSGADEARRAAAGSH